MTDTVAEIAPPVRRRGRSQSGHPMVRRVTDLAWTQKPVTVAYREKVLLFATRDLVIIPGVCTKAGDFEDLRGNPIPNEEVTWWAAIVLPDWLKITDWKDTPHSTPKQAHFARTNRARYEPAGQWLTPL